MASVTDDERRRVAAALRGLTSNVYGLRKSYESEDLSILCDDQADYYQMCKAVCGYLPPEHMHPCDYEELHFLLADLIEPSCDREALLALADDLCGEYPYGLSHGGLEQLARRIREACGVVG